MGITLKKTQTNGFEPVLQALRGADPAWSRILTSIPVVAFWSREEFIDVDLNEDSNRMLHSIMKTFNLTWKEALEAFISYTYQAGDMEIGSIWL